jgi:hypothetical protein
LGHGLIINLQTTQKISEVEPPKDNDQPNRDNKQCERRPDAMIDRKPPPDSHESDRRQGNDWQRHESEPSGRIMKREPEVFRGWLMRRGSRPQVQTSAHNERVQQCQPCESICGQNHWQTVR